MRRLLIAMFGAALTAPFAFADAPKMVPMKPVSPVSIDDAVRANPSCESFTNGCEICQRSTDGPMQCSAPGIACQPQIWACQHVR